MTVSYKPTQDQDPQEPGSQYSSDGAKRSDNVAGASFSAPTQPGSALGQQGNPAGLPRSIRPNAVVKPPVTPPTAARFFAAENGSRPGFNPAQSGEANGNGAGQTRHPAALRNAPKTGVMSYAASPAELAQNAQKPEVENGNIILYRTHNFFLRTAYRPDHRSNPLRRPTGHTTVMPRVLPDQEKRIAASETRVMPNVTLNIARQTRAIPMPSWVEAILLVISLVGVLVAHAYNMFNFPRYELDEGTYMSNAWGITQGWISPYPYGYGHPPLAWIQIAGWLQLTGGPFIFGNALNSGRVFMLFYAAGSALLVYLIARRMGGSASAGILALVVFSFSPLGITYQRQVFLDNIATFWMLLSLYLLVVGNSRLQYIIGAAVAFGFSVLSKEVYLICFPVLIYAAWLYTTKFQRKFGMVAFIYAAIAVCSAFVLMAVLKDELFPYSWHLPWDTHPHLSMLDTLVGQAQRGQVGGSFQASWEIWIENDPLIIILSIVFPLFNLVYGWWNRKHLMLSLMAIIFWLLLVRGGQVLSFYILPLIPLAALNMALALNTVMGWLGKLVRFDLVRVALLIVVIAIVLPYDIKAIGFRFYQHPTSAQQDAMVWVRNHVSHNAFIVINSYLYVDLQLPGGQGTGDGAPYPHAEVYWNVAFDPELHDRTLQKNWDRIDYIVADSEMLNDIKTYGSGMNLIKQAYQHSVLRAEFRADDHNLQIVVQVYQVIHQYTPPTVYSGQGSGPGATIQTNGPPLFNGSPRGDPSGIAEQRKILSVI